MEKWKKSSGCSNIPDGQVNFKLDRYTISFNLFADPEFPGTFVEWKVP